MRHQVERLKHVALRQGVKPARALTATLVAVGMMAAAAISFVPTGANAVDKKEDGDFAPGFVLAVDIASPRLLGDSLEGYAAQTQLCIDHHGTNERYAQRLLCDGVIIKPWREKGYEHWIRVSVGNEQDNQQFIRSLKRILAEDAA